MCVIVGVGVSEAGKNSSIRWLAVLVPLVAWAFNATLSWRVGWASIVCTPCLSRCGEEGRNEGASGVYLCVCLCFFIPLFLLHHVCISFCIPSYLVELDSCISWGSKSGMYFIWQSPRHRTTLKGEGCTVVG